MKSIFDSDTGALDSGTWSGGGTDVHNVLKTEDLSVFRYTGEEGETLFQDMVIVNIAETFSEGESRADVMTDTYVSFATGAQPIGITISGYLVRLTKYDSRIDFLKVYDEKLRGTKIGAVEWDLEFCLKDATIFTLALQRVQIIDSIQFPDMTAVSLQGVAYNYDVTSTEIIEEESEE